MGIAILCNMHGHSISMTRICRTTFTDINIRSSYQHRSAGPVGPSGMDKDIMMFAESSSQAS